MSGFPPNLFAGLRFAVVGLGKNGAPAARALMAMGAEVTAWDDSVPARAAAAGLALRDLRDGAFDFDALVLSPGIPHTFPAPHPIATRATAAQIPILSDVELLFRAVRMADSQARFVGITGTNGKSTTTALLAHILACAGVPTAAGGNLGPAALALPLLPHHGVYILEMSSYMLERIATVRFDAAAMLNLSADHIDRHGDMAGYTRAKRAVFDRQTASDLAVVGVDDALSREMAAGLPTHVMTVSGTAADADIRCVGGILSDAAGPIFRMADAPALPGAHNAQNAAAAAAVAFFLGVSREEVARGLASYPGLPHRQQLVATIDGVRFVNDSKATNADATERALVCYDRIIWIAGGMAKEGGIVSLAPLFPRVARALLIGRDAPIFAETLAANGVRFETMGTLEAAVPAAFEAAQAERAPVVLLSPACASWDQFTGYDQRGDRFAELARGLASREGCLMPLSRADNSLLGRWWWTVDRWTLGAIGILIGFGYIMMLAASPAVAERIGQSRDLFIFKQVFFLALASAIVVGVSLLSPRDIRRLAIAGCIVALVLTAATMVVGVEIKGARRWIALPGMSVQPSEFLKPCFAVTAAWLIAEGRRSRRFPGMLIACAVFALILLLLKSQPDIGMLAVVTAVFLAQLYVAGMNLFLVLVALGMIGGGSVMAYFLFPHVQSRVERFLHPESGDTYQITTALEAFGNGGLLGRGPGEGRVKDVLPDAHADFVFAVAGEEFGMLICLVILAVFAFIVLRGLLKLLKEQDLFIVLSCTGLVTGFGLQAFVNMASTLKLIPTKGMTLPFISYGGSSVMAVALGMGMLLALTRRRHRGDEA